MTTLPKYTKFHELSRPYHMTIKDVINLPKGEGVKIMFLDRNLYDLAKPPREHKNNKNYKGTLPSKIFANNYYINFKRTDGISGEWGEIDGLEPMHTRPFHIDLGSCWYPLDEKGFVPKNDEDGIFDLGEMSGKHWTDFPKDTLLGWRGAMIRVSDMDKVGRLRA